VRNGRQLWSVPSGVIVELEQRHGEKFHILGDAQHL
jgi:hypothetical protein